MPAGTSAMNEWKRFFDHHAPEYDQEVFTQNTESEIDFLLAEFQLPRGAHILDVGCGTGRHSVGLALRGYRVTGVDISEQMIDLARLRAQASGVHCAALYRISAKTPRS